MERAELVELCHRSCYQLVMVALDDPETWERMLPALRP
jgi:hypothetical protein